MRVVLCVLFLLAACGVASAEGISVPVTHENQQKVGVEFTLTVEKHPDPTLDTVWVKITLAKKGKLERLDEVLLQIKDGDALTLRVPLALKEEKGVWVGTFHMSPAQAKKCEIHLVCHTPVRTSVVTYNVQLATYLAAPKPDRTEKVTLQYRTAKDPVAPSGFVAVIDGKAVAPLDITWDVRRSEDPDEREKAARQFNEFEHLIKLIEVAGINGVEFECKGEWVKKGVKLRVTTVPQPTESGQKAIKDIRR
jgi:hypothetical protein